ncbi:hypothetical protein [Rhodovulum euryhalinum]|uniref:CRISPR type IV-associated protein Csf2 n=1 Tax=Rhodovulum euryhalinum TaxID=35805 RepID=A0A4R2KA00_9RHOB|nr:hypothetical protein [Rhodovulum euryhalinum]TCO70253.1 CRISPR type IV-associated protein Csf2 [Rhodovulum euryhalinum]
MTKTYRLDGYFRLKSPLSHIGESISNKSYLVQETILQDDGTTEEVFVYSGNAWRGQLRDLCASYMLDNLGGARVPMDAFHLLFSGGRIGGTQITDIGQARRIRAAIPMVAVFGGGVGNQILQGKLRVGNCYPVCREAVPVLPAAFHEQAAGIPYGRCTMEKEHSRRDDAKIDSIRRHLAAEDCLLLEGDGGKKKGKGDVADQMRIGMELVSPGVTLHTWITLEDASEVELGALVAGLHRFSANPAIGGKSAIGYGQVDLHYNLTFDGETQSFLSIQDGVSRMSQPAEVAKEAYDQHLRAMYDAMLAAEKSEITKLLGAA